MSPAPAPTASPAKANLAAASEGTVHTELAAKPAKRMEKKPYTGERRTEHGGTGKGNMKMPSGTTMRPMLLSSTR